MENRLTIEAQLSKLLQKKVFNAVLLKAMDVLEPTVLEELKERWTRRMNTSFALTSENEERTANESVLTSSAGFSNIQSVENTGKECNDLTHKCQNTKRLREEVPHLPSMRNVQGFDGLPRKSAESAQSSHTLSKKGVSSGITNM